MNILWLINISLPEASILLGEKPSPFGGWLVNASKDLSNQKDIKLSIAFPCNKSSKIKMLKGEKINYHLFNPINYKNTKAIQNNESFERIIDEVKPDVVHIYGTEMAHTLSMVNVCKRLGIETVVSIQGLVSIYAQHIYASLPYYAVYGFTFRNLLRKDSVYWNKRNFEQRGKNETKALENTNHIIGRTTWDKACSSQINPWAKYHFCNETLRKEFYSHKWELNKCEKYSIFLSQGQYPIKGLHYMIEAMPLILERFPLAKVYVSGKDITRSETLKDKLLMTYYGKYVRNMIRKLKLEEKFIFTGPLDEQKMCQRYLMSNVFVCPSSIENSPNSLGEAMILGLPCVASDVGGVSDMLKHKEEGFVYQTDAPYMLAHYVCTIFENEDLTVKFSNNAREHALLTHDREENTSKLINIYNDILSNNS